MPAVGGRIESKNFAGLTGAGMTDERIRRDPGAELIAKRSFGRRLSVGDNGLQAWRFRGFRITIARQ